MRRTGNLYKRICSIENLEIADKKASKGKSWQKGVQDHMLDREENILQLHKLLIEHKYRTSEYTTFKIYEPKEREIFRLPYYPDRIVHHAIMNVLEPIFMRLFTADTYSCIKERGIHGAFRAVRKALIDREGTKYCLKLDIRKFYPSVDHDILKELLKRKIKDIELLELLYEIIDSSEGLPIGNYLSQYLANYYMSYFDRWLKEDKRVKYYFRYADDIVILSSNKEDLHKLLGEITVYLKEKLKLKVKNNYQVFPVAASGLDFVGYRFFPTHTRLRKSIKQNFARMVRRNKNRASIASYNGWAVHGNCRNLMRKLLS
ncbi:MAG: reverse transcriptase [Ignavibacteria bacterium]|nr:reverse transcriptase [Ignavibacteria bacterium]